MAYIIDTPVRLFHHQDYGTRLIFVNGNINPRDALGKIGVDIHNNAAAMARSVIKVQVNVLLEGGESELRVLNINRNSLRKYLCAYHGADIPKSRTNEELVTCLNQTLADVEIKKPELRHAGKHDQRSLDTHKVGDKLRGKFYSWLYLRTIETLSKLRKRFIFARTEKAYFRVSEILAKLRFNEASVTVPAYREFIKNDEHYRAAHTKKFADIPVTSKDNYIKPNSQQDRKLHVGGSYPAGKKKTDTSTGTTGKPTSWVRSALEVRTVKKSLKVAAQIEYGGRPLEYINAFALGQWATGMTAYEMMRATGSVFAASPDGQKILDRLEDIYREENGQIDDDIHTFIEVHAAKYLTYAEKLKPLVRDLVNAKFKDKNFNVSMRLAELEKEHGFEFISGNRRQLAGLIAKIDAYKAQIIITGYPPFLMDLVDTAAKKAIDFSKYQACGVVGGQGISEKLREALVTEGGFRKINSSYGASDCDINIGMETDFEMKFRKVLEANPALAEELYGKGRGVPMVFHYDPFNYHIEASKEDELIFTCNRSDRSSPRVRYALGDTGRVYAASDLEAVLVKHGILHLKPKVNFPLLFVWGRESAVAYRGAKVAYSELERAIMNLDVDKKYVKRAFYSYQDEVGADQFDIWVELREGEVIPSEGERKHFLAKLLLELAALNPDFKYHLDVVNDAPLPKLRYYTKSDQGQSPIGESNGHHKQVLVLTKQNLSKNFPGGYHAPRNPEIMVETELPKAQLQTSAQDAGVHNKVGYGSHSPRFMRVSDTMESVLDEIAVVAPLRH